MQFDVRVRLTPSQHVTGVARPFAEGIAQTLFVRTKSGERPLDQAEFEAWDDPLDGDVWASAWALTRMLERPQEINRIDASGTKLMHLFSDTVFGASFVPYLRDVLDGTAHIGENGALVSMPLAHSVLVHPIAKSPVVQAAKAMIPITRQVHHSGPSSLSTHVYWWRDGDLTWIPTFFGRRGVEFHAPNGLADLIAQDD